MPSAALTAELPQAKRFHQPWWRVRIAIGMVMGGFGATDLVGGHATLHIVQGLLWICFGTFYIASGWTLWSEVRPEGLLQRNFWAINFIPYSDITAVEQRTDNGHPVDVQYSSLSREILPRKTVTVRTPERTQFVGALRARAPQAEFRP